MTIRRIRRGAVALGAAALVLALAPTQSVTAAPPSPGDPAAPGSAGQATAEAARVASYWTPARRAAATPRDLLLDQRGNGYLRTAAGLQPYGTKPTPQAKPGGGSGDTTKPTVTPLAPAPDSILSTTSSVFSATVIDDGGLRSVTFRVRRSGTTTWQQFSGTTTGSNIYSATLQGFTDGSWEWSVTATDLARNTTTTPAIPFSVAISGGSGGGSGGTGVVPNAEWTADGDVQHAAGRIYFEMRSSKTRWSGYVCSGTVVTDGATAVSVILTAAHCVFDDKFKDFARNVLFIPNQAGTTGAGTDRDCTNDPLGCWSPTLGVVDENWTTRTFPDNIPWDYAYYIAESSLETAAGSLPVSFSQPATGAGALTHALGYSYSDDPNFMYCAEDMTDLDTANWWLSQCGLSGGASGGPWLQPVNAGNGTVISVNSWGYTTGPGMAGPKLSGTTAKCLFDWAQTQATATQPRGIVVKPASCPSG